jgi:ABC-type glutathione transport system ATPase component
MALIDGLRDELGFANILISHNLPRVAAHCQRLACCGTASWSRKARPPRSCSRRVPGMSFAKKKTYYSYRIY